MAFKEALAAKRDALVSSNHDNLSHAYLRVEKHLEYLKKKYEEDLNKGTQLLADIEAAADTHDILTDESGSETMKLYNKATAFARS